MEKFGNKNKYEGTPSWIRDHMEVLDASIEATRIKKFEAEYPGIREVFEGLIRRLPHPDADKEEFPFAAAIIRKTAEGKVEVLAAGSNMVNDKVDSTQHAEVVVIQEAQKKIGGKHLDDCALLTTVQPCMMCAGGVMNTAITQVVYGASQEDIRGKHVLFGKVYKPFRTTPQSLDVDTELQNSGIKVFPGYMREEVLEAIERIPVTTYELYADPDVKL